MKRKRLLKKKRKLSPTVEDDQQDVGDKLQIDNRSISDVAAGSSSSTDPSHGEESLMTNNLPPTVEDDQQDVGDNLHIEDTIPSADVAAENVGDELQIEDRSTSELDVAAGSSSSTDPSHNIVEDFNFQAFLNQDEKFPVSDQKCIEELDLQEALMMSSSAPEYEYATSSSTDNLPFIPYVSYESSQVPDKFCGICMDTKTDFEMFINENVCVHTFCIDCIRSHIGSKINENVSNVKCPDPNCKGLIEPNVCRFILPEEVISRWDHALCESLMIGSSQNLYCPYKDCSAPLLVDENGVPTKDTECPYCNRMFCAQCKVPWHSEMDCKEFQMLSENGELNQSDMKVRELAKENKWKRCPKCNYYVARTTGCNSMSCRCGHSFCYACGCHRCSCYRRS